MCARASCGGCPPSQHWLLRGGDHVGLHQTRRWVNHLYNRLRDRQGVFLDQRDAEGRAEAMLGNVPSEALFKALDAMRMQASPQG